MKTIEKSVLIWFSAREMFDLIVDVFGADHAATAPQVLLGVKALGYDPSIVRTIMQLHGGSAVAHSVPGGLTTFTIRFPPAGSRQRGMPAR